MQMLEFLSDRMIFVPYIALSLSMRDCMSGVRR